MCVCLCVVDGKLLRCSGVGGGGETSSQDVDGAKIMVGCAVLFVCLKSK